MKRRQFLYIASLAPTLVAVPVLQARQQGQRGGSYTVESDSAGKVIKTPDGRIVVGYVTVKDPGSDMTAPSVCCFHPLLTPSGERLTVFGAGHRHYRGVFFGWHTVEYREPIEQPPAGRGRAGGPPPNIPPEVLTRQNSPRRGNVLIGDYWGWGRYAPLEGRVIRNRDVRLAKADATGAQLEIENEWTIHNQVLMDERLTAVVRGVPGANVLDVTYRFTPRDVDVVLPEWSFGGLCVSGRSDAETAYYEGPDGPIDLPNPSMVDGNTSWPDAAWYRRTHTLAGKTAGYGVVNHPANPKTRWWNPPSTGNIQPSIVTYGEFSIPHGQTLTLRYRVVGYDGVLPLDRMNQLSADFRST